MIGLSEPKITIIIPVYNVSRYIEQCILSVQSQTYDDFKIVVINDGSTDDSWDKAIALLKDDSRATLVSKANEGLGPTRNLGIKMAETDYVTFLDSDDWWREDYIESMMSGVDCDADIILGDYYFFDQLPEGKNKTTISSIRMKKGLTKVLSENNILSKARNFACGKTFKKRLFTDNDVWFPPHHYEDVSLVSYVVSCAEKVYCIGDPLYFYRRNREGSIRSDLLSLYKIADSLEELYSRFVTSGRIKLYKNQLRQLVWGQYCFVEKRVRNNLDRIDEKEAKDIMKTVSDVCFCRFPELEGFSKGKIYANSDDLVLMKALTCIVPNPSNIVSEKDEADYIVMSECTGSKINDTRVLYVNVAYEDKDIEDETMIWNIAEEIMAQI